MIGDDEVRDCILDLATALYAEGHFVTSKAQ
jgi:hypothetical protein